MEERIESREELESRNPEMEAKRMVAISKG
jgi:hypothetical protein